jgi:hypothetical protein
VCKVNCRQLRMIFNFKTHGYERAKWIYFENFKSGGDQAGVCVGPLNGEKGIFAPLLNWFQKVNWKHICRKKKADGIVKILIDFRCTSDLSLGPIEHFLT